MRFKILNWSDSHSFSCCPTLKPSPPLMCNHTGTVLPIVQMWGGGSKEWERERVRNVTCFCTDYNAKLVLILCMSSELHWSLNVWEDSCHVLLFPFFRIYTFSPFGFPLRVSFTTGPEQLSPSIGNQLKGAGLVHSIVHVKTVKSSICKTEWLLRVS